MSFEEACFQEFWSYPTQTGLCSCRKRLEARNLGLKEKRDLAKTKALISCAGTAQLICVFVFANMQKDIPGFSRHWLLN